MRQYAARMSVTLKRWAVLVTLPLLYVMVTALPAHAVVLVSDVPVGAWRVNGDTETIEIVGDVVYVGGTFTQAIAPNGTTRPRANLAAFNATTGALIEGFRADTNGTVRAIAGDAGTLWVGGSFTTVNGATRQRLASLDPATGAPRAVTANASNIVYALDLRAGRLFAAGVFTTIGGVPRNRGAALNPATGAVDPQFSPQPNATVRAIRANPSGSTVYLAGEFTTLGGVARTGLGAVSGVTGAAQNPVFQSTYAPTFALDMNEDGSRLFAAVGGAGNQVAAYHTGTGQRLWRQRADGDVQAVAYGLGHVYWGFHESFEGDTTLRLLASNAVSGAVDTDFRPTFNRFWGVRAIAFDNAAVAVGGDFTLVSGVASQGLGLFRASGPPPVTYVDSGAVWRYSATGASPGTGWAAPGFDDSAWPSGRSQLGFGDGDEITVVPFGPDPANKYVTTYFRITFDVASIPAAGVSLSLNADDGAVVYLNGVEVARDNIGTGVVTYGTFAAERSPENVYTTFPIAPSSLVVGVNTLAVEVHQSWAGSSDLSMDLRLAAS